MGTDGPIFFIGFNKCGTLSLHHHLLKCGLRSFHGGSSDRHFDEVILVNISYSDQPLYGVPPYDAWSDSVPVQREFRYFDLHYPTARFVLNTRDVLRWVVSRLNHLDGNYVTFMNLAYRRELAWQEWADEWRCEFLAHECAVTAHFAGRANFLYFNIETDPVGKLNEFLRLAGAAELTSARECRSAALVFARRRDNNGARWVTVGCPAESGSSGPTVQRSSKSNRSEIECACPFRRSIHV